MAYMFGLNPKTVYAYYKNNLSGYPQAKEAGQWGEKKIIVADKDTGEVVKEKPVPIAKVKNVGSHMTLDEKQISKKMYTVMTNTQSGKIALLAQTLKVEELKQAITNYFAGKTHEVKSISADMSPSYLKLCREMFPDAQVVVDKFHVIKHLLDALQQVRRQLKTKRLNRASSRSKRNTKSKSQEKRLTTIEQLERSRYVLYKMQEDWDSDEIEMMAQLFAQYPVLHKAYALTQELRNWYNGEQIGKCFIALDRELHAWYDRVEQANIPAFNSVQKMMERHQELILHYFKEGQTNAKAENMNGKIQRFLSSNFGVRDRDFFFYRVAGYFS